MTPVPRPLRSALIDAMGGWGPYSVNEIHNLFEDYDFFERDLSVEEQGMRRTAAGAFLDCIDWDNAGQRKRLLALIDDVLTHYPVPEGEPDKGPGGRLRKMLERTLQNIASPSDDEFAEVLETLDAEHVKMSWQKALERRQGDPEGAITASRTTLESVCKLILDDLGADYDDADDLPSLYRKVANELKLAPSDHVEQAFKQILGGVMSVVNGLATIRNRLSDSHGKGKRAVRPSARHANLAVNLAGTVAVFLIETWQARTASADRAQA
jgi:hypothetical protein